MNVKFLSLKKLILFLICLFFIADFDFQFLVFNKIFIKLSVGYIIGKNNFYESLISIVSLLENKNRETFIDIYSIVGVSLTEENIKILQSLKSNYINLNITIINNNEDVEIHNDEDKLILFSKFIKFFQLNKILYLNSDTLIFKDLSVLFNLNFGNKYFICFDNLLFKYVLLINLRKIQKDNCIQNYIKMKICLSLSNKRIGIRKKFAANRIFKKVDVSWEKNEKIYSYDELFNTYDFPNIIYFNETQPYLTLIQSIKIFGIYMQIKQQNIMKLFIILIYLLILTR